MKKYDYLKHVQDDVKDYLKSLDVGKFGLLLQQDEDTIDEVEDELFVNDNVTGNGSGSYTMNREEAEQNLGGNWQLLKEARDELDPNVDVLDKGAEFCDVLIRCYLLDEALNECLNELLTERTKEQ